MSTSVDRKYNNIVQEALTNYKTAMETNSSNTRLKTARKAIKLFEKGFEFAQYIDLSAQMNEISQYIALCYDLQGQSYYDLKNYPEAQSSFENALKTNKGTDKDDKKIMREIIFRKDLLETLYIIEDVLQIEHHATLLSNLIKKISDVEESLSYSHILIRYFTKIQDWNQVDKHYIKLMKICGKKAVQLKFPKEIIDYFEEYGDYLKEKKQLNAESLKMYRKALNIAEKEKLKDKIAIINAKLT